eukprot:CAMPEP_0202687900 /NCGR_PEP_ID=MMETSP1385-20130828/3462_1 /ASSEMBLY_ACC=CAM_ASM_000861 /TAXON_ID=933848 /ORGANISM="Elphidium margaritaceum" /LENGTH=866 /DNA_ID=CAMNT_0049342753 /DNA_START=25 /DNA_END=2625 /DNA_ORIENTATION=-
MAQPSDKTKIQTSSPRSSSKSYTFSKDANIYNLTPKQQAVHQGTIHRHLSSRKPSDGPSLHTPIISSPFANRTQLASHTHSGGGSVRRPDEDTWDQEEKSVASQSRSVVPDLPVFAKSGVARAHDKTSAGASAGAGMKKNFSAPSMSALQQQKLEQQVYLHPRQIPRSFSADVLDYQPPMELSLIMDLPTDAFMGIGGGLRSVKSLLQIALQKIESDIRQMDADDIYDRDGREEVYGTAEAIPSAPMAIPPSAMEIAVEAPLQDIDELLMDGDDDVDELHRAAGAVPRRKSSAGLPRVDSRARAQTMKHDIETALTQGYTRNLCVAVLQALTGAFLYGWNVAILNVPQPVVQNQVTHMSDSEYALLATMFCAGGLVGAFMAGPLQDRIGRKSALLCIDVLFIVSAAICFLFCHGVFGPVDAIASYAWLWFGRFLVGVASGGATAVVPTYLGEISPPLIRGAIGTSNQLTICFGVVAVSVMSYKSLLGSAHTWSYLFLGNAIPLLQLFTAWTFPESPKWLVQKGRDAEARTALQQLRETVDVRVDMWLMRGGNFDGASADKRKSSVSPHASPPQARKASFATLARLAQQEKSKPATTTTTTTTTTDKKAGGKEPLLSANERQQMQHYDEGVSINKRAAQQTTVAHTGGGGEAARFGMPLEMWRTVKWATIIGVALMLMQQLSGINAVFFYSATILQQAGLTSDLEIWLGTVAIAVANFLAVFIAVFSIDRAGRTVLLIRSCIVMGVASILVSVAIQLEHTSTVWQYSSIAFLVLFVIGFEVGLGAIPWLMTAELSPMQYRGPIVAIATASNWGANLIIAQFSGPIVNLALFYPFAVVCALGVVFTVKFIPETNGKTAQQIQKALSNI